MKHSEKKDLDKQHTDPSAFICSHTYNMPLTLNEIFEQYTSNSDDRTQRVEVINLARLGYIISLGEKSEFVTRAEQMSKKKKGFSGYEPVYDHITKLFKRAQHIPGTPFGVIHSQFFQPHGENGRLNAVGNMSLQVTSRMIRHAIGAGQYLDIDICNCHPVFLLKYCRDNKIPRKALKYIIRNREAVIKNVIEMNPGLIRDDVKQAILSLLNGGNSAYQAIKNKPEELIKFAVEIKETIKSIASLNPKLLKDITTKRKKSNKDFNHEGALMCVILQGMESQALGLMEDVFRDHGFITSSIIPAHDGLLAPISCTKNIEEIMRECEQRISDEMDIDVSICQKVMNAHEDFDFSEADDPTKWEALCKKQDENLEFQPLDNYYFCDFAQALVNNGTPWPTFSELAEFYNANAKRVLIRTRDEEIFIKLNDTDQFHYVKTLPKDTIKYFAEDSKIKTVRISELITGAESCNSLKPIHGFYFEPAPIITRETMMKKNKVNLWTGFSAKLLPQNTVDMELIKPILDHIKIVLSNRDENIYDYFLSWFHHAFRYPNKLTKVAIILRSAKQQVGKGIFLHNFLLKYVYGANASVTGNGLDFLVCRFNDSVKNKVLAVAEELDSIEGKGYHSMFNTLKAIITDPTRTVEIKNGPKYSVDNYMNIIACTNHDFTIRVEKYDSRYFIVECNDEMVGNHSYFNKLSENMTQESADHFFSYCFYYRQDNPRSIKNIPMTELKRQMQFNCLSTPQRFIELCREFIDGGGDVIEAYESWHSLFVRLCYEDGVLNEWIKSADLYRIYSRYCEEEKEKALSATKFGREICDVMKKKKSSDIKYSFGVGPTRLSAVEVESDDEF